MLLLLRMAVKPKNQPLQSFIDAAGAVLQSFPEIVMQPVEDSLLIKACEESQLELATSALRKHFGKDVFVGNLSVEYLETVTKSIEREGKIFFDKQQDYAQVWLRITPCARGSGPAIVNVAAKDAVPEQFISSIEAGVREALIRGPIAGYQMTDVEVLLIDGSYNSNSTSRAFKMAAFMACQQGLTKCGPILLEPIMTLELSLPLVRLGETIGDLAARRGLVLGQTETPLMGQIAAQVPLAELLGYRSYLKSVLLGEATCSIKFSHYDRVPPLPGLMTRNLQAWR